MIRRSAFLPRVAPAAALLSLVVLAVPLRAQLPAIRDLAPGASVGKYGEVIDVVELASGALVVADAEETLWRVAAGATSGTKVKPKGNLLGVSDIGWAGGDSIFVFATRAPQAVVLRANDEVGATLGQAPTNGFFMISPGSRGLGADANGRLYSVVRQGIGEDAAPLVAEGAGGSRQVTTMAGMSGGRMVIGAGGAMQPMKVLLPADAWAVRPDGAVAVARAEPYRVEWYRDGKRTAEGPAVPWTPVPTSSEDAKEAKERMERTLSRMPQIQGMTGGAPEIELPPTKPAFGANAVRMGGDGSVWVQLLQPARAAQEVWDHFDEQGRHLERVRFASGQRVRGFGRSAAYVSGPGGDKAELLRVPLS